MPRLQMGWLPRPRRPLGWLLSRPYLASWLPTIHLHPFPFHRLFAGSATSRPSCRHDCCCLPRIEMDSHASPTLLGSPVTWITIHGLPGVLGGRLSQPRLHSCPSALAASRVPTWPRKTATHHWPSSRSLESAVSSNHPPSEVLIRRAQSVPQTPPSTHMTTGRPRQSPRRLKQRLELRTCGRLFPRGLRTAAAVDIARRGLCCTHICHSSTSRWRAVPIPVCSSLLCSCIPLLILSFP